MSTACENLSQMVRMSAKIAFQGALMLVKRKLGESATETRRALGPLGSRDHSHKEMEKDRFIFTPKSAL